jgi:hypothetical protein
VAAIFNGKSFILIAATKRVGLIQALGGKSNYACTFSKDWTMGSGQPSSISIGDGHIYWHSTSRVPGRARI